MAEDNDVPPRNFVDALVEDPANPPQLQVLTGYPGRSAQEGHGRLYIDPELTGWVDIPDDAVLFRKETRDEYGLGKSLVWTTADAKIESGPQQAGGGTGADFLQGQVAQDLGGGAAGAQAQSPPTLLFCPTRAPLLCPRTLLCPTPPRLCPPTPRCLTVVPTPCCPFPTINIQECLPHTSPAICQAATPNPGCIPGPIGGPGPVEGGQVAQALGGAAEAAIPPSQLFCPTHAPFLCPQTQINCPTHAPFLCPQTQLFCPTHAPFLCPQTQINCPTHAPFLCPQTQINCPTHAPFLCPQTPQCPTQPTACCPSPVAFCPASAVDACPSRLAPCPSNQIPCPPHTTNPVQCPSLGIACTFVPPCPPRTTNPVQCPSLGIACTLVPPCPPRTTSPEQCPSLGFTCTALPPCPPQTVNPQVCPSVVDACPTRICTRDVQQCIPQPTSNPQLCPVATPNPGCIPGGPIGDPGGPVEGQAGVQALGGFAIQRTQSLQACIQPTPPVTIQINCFRTHFEPQCWITRNPVICWPQPSPWCPVTPGCPFGGGGGFTPVQGGGGFQGVQALQQQAPNISLLHVTHCCCVQTAGGGGF